MSLTNMQKEALDGIIKWYNSKTKQVCKLVGYAGTGKTFIIHYIIKELKLKKSQVAFATYTGKASLVLKERLPKYHCMTTHKLLYNTKIIDNQPVFELKSKKDLSHIKLIVIDEASMITEEIYEDLLSFDIPVLLTGDQGQLPPVGPRFDALENPDFILTEIHRQAEDNPVIHLSMLARVGKVIEPGTYGDNVLVVRESDLKKDQLDRIYQNSDQIICGYNKTRNKINRRVRKILGFKGDVPQIGEKVICLKNSWNKEFDGFPLINGMTGYIEAVDLSSSKNKYFQRESFLMKFRPDFANKGGYDNLIALVEDFSEKPPKLEGYENIIYERFDFGWAITCHKSQGSQYDNVTVLNEVLNSQMHNQWLYTAVTRTKDKLILIL